MVLQRDAVIGIRQACEVVPGRGVVTRERTANSVDVDVGSVRKARIGMHNGDAMTALASHATAVGTWGCYVEKAAQRALRWPHLAPR